MPRLRRTLTILGGSAAALLAFTAAVGGWTYAQLGATPGELMDYAERRLEGHTKLEWVALPAIGVVRDLLDQPSKVAMRKMPFDVPRPPPLKRIEVSVASLSPERVNQRILRVGPEREIRTIAQAAKLAQDGDLVIVDAGNYYGDVAVWHQKKLTLRAVGGNARLFANGKSAEGKAIWVIRSGDFTIENFDFVGTHVTDRNGAGIRFEAGSLHVSNCLFFGNDSGLIVSSGATSVRIDNSEFAYNGFGAGYSHSLYVNKIKSLTVTSSYFHHANIGHHIKSRAQQNHIAYNRITDETGGRASYEIDLPNGGLATVLGNIVQQGAQAQNSTLISYGAEGLVWPANRLYLASNTLVNDHPYGGTFIRTAPGTQRFVAVNNLMVGPGRWFGGPLAPENLNNNGATWSDFVKASRYDYRLSADGKAKLPYTKPAMPELEPLHNYRDTALAPAIGGPAYLPGAMSR